MNLEKALQIATDAHRNQYDKYGAPYLLHVVRVMQRGKSEAEQIVGLLHDVVEDTPLTFDDLRAAGFSEEIVAAVQCLTRPPEESYEAFIERIKTNRLAVAVKLNDLEDNMDLRRVPYLTEKDLPRVNKYLKAYHELKNLR
jgi:(p)ppGpp synthase/HD superfamily hydrolase